MNETVEYVFAIIGMASVIFAIVFGITVLVVKIVHWKNGKEYEVNKLFTRTGGIDRRLDELESHTKSETKLIWQSIDDMNKRLKYAERQATKSAM